MAATVRVTFRLHRPEDGTVAGGEARFSSTTRCEQQPLFMWCLP